MSPGERRALLTLLGLLVSGQAVRMWLLRPGDAPGAVALLVPAGDSARARHRAASAQAGRPLAEGERLDLNTAPAAQLDRLPRVGPALARRIVEDRTVRGPFRTLGDLDRVPGVGPALLEELASKVTQPPGPPSGTPGSGGRGPVPVNLNTASEAELLRLPGIGPTKARAIVAYRQGRGPFASVADLVRVPGIGPATLAGLAGLVSVR